ncbi:unnamed protein product [Dovyalis caffra]|uniref:Uncharacterized protein n=1 Tax=Dovyalis caffra TaxID=77055 RepID=A0AAV1QWJ5_9ROSI|nr:unnamed protein product [Dovyalis caffra]
MSGIDKPSGVSGSAGAGRAPASGSTGLGSGSAAAKDGTMKAPGQDIRISREGFEKNPAGYFQELHKKQKKISGINNPSGVSGGAGAGKAPASGSTGLGSGSGAAKDGTMKAPGQDVRIPREAFEKNAAGYFQQLHKK